LATWKLLAVDLCKDFFAMKRLEKRLTSSTVDFSGLAVQKPDYGAVPDVASSSPRPCAPTRSSSG
jgi:hypothetical protein